MRRRGLLLWLLVPGGALALRLALWAQPFHLPANDEVEYIAVARDLLAGRGWVFYESYHWLRAPLYPLFLAAALWLAGGDLRLAALPNIVLSLGLVALIGLLTSELCLERRPQNVRSAAQGGQTAPLLAALLAAGLLTNVTFASLYMSETLFAVLLCAAFFWLLRWRRLGGAHWCDRRLLLAGFCFGLATLTRSAPLLFVPLALGWIVWSARQGTTGEEAQTGQQERQPPRRQWPAGLVFLLVVSLTIAPWTIRNCRAYGSCILVETGFSYNLWAFSEPREDQATIFRTLEQIANPAERATEATRRGLERLREDPAIVLRKLWPNWVYLWRVKPIQDRFLQQSYRADPPAPLFLAALLFDDLLGLVIMVVGLGTLGLAAARGRPAAWLIALWIAYVVGVTMVTHGESRYRHFFLFALIPYAAIGLLTLVHRLARGSVLKQPAERLSGPARGLSVLALLVALFVGYTALRAYPWDYALGGAFRSWNRMAGDLALARGDISAAEEAYRRALAASETPDGWLALARIHAVRGEREQQADAYGAASVLALSYPLPHLLLADLYRREGRDDEARAAFVGRYIAEQEMLAWSWNHVADPPAGRVAVGDGLDFGYVNGLYPAEELAGARVRWSGARVRLRLPGEARLLRLRVIAPREGETPLQAELCAEGACRAFELSAGWQVLSLNLPPAGGSMREVELRTPTFPAPDGRELGLVIDWFEGLPHKDLPRV